MSDLTPKVLSSAMRWAKVFLIVGIVTGFSGIVHNAYVHFNPAAERQYGGLVHSRIGGRDFAVPSEYVRGPLPRGDVKQLYLWLTLPDFQPYKGDYSESKNSVPIGFRLITVLIDDAQTTTDLAYRYHARHSKEFFLTPVSEAPAYGLSRSTIFRKLPTDTEKYVWFDLYYTPRSDMSVSRFISCGKDEPAPRNPMCDHLFQDGRLLYAVTYSKKNLAKWNEIERQVRGLVESFECKPFSNQTISTQNIKGPKPCPR